MKPERFRQLAALFLGYTLLGACSACSEAGRSNGNLANNTNNVNVIIPKQAANGLPAADNTNSQVITYPGSNKSENPTLDESKVKVIDMSKVKLQPLQPRKMPDNSEILTVQSPDGRAFVETRKFNNDQQLDKLERITKSGTDRIVKVYLRNGKVVRISNDKLKNFSTDSSSSILLAAGIEPVIPKNADPRSQGRILKVKPGAN